VAKLLSKFDISGDTVSAWRSQKSIKPWFLLWKFTLVLINLRCIISRVLAMKLTAKTHEN